jgi:hypothetical protein
MEYFSNFGRLTKFVKLLCISFGKCYVYSIISVRSFTREEEEKHKELPENAEQELR